MRAGSLDRRLKFQRRDETQDAFGTEDANAWTDVFTCWARFATPQGKEFARAQLLLADVEAVIVTRYCSELAAITEKDRIYYGGKVYDIRFVNNVNEARVELQFLCTLHK